MGSYFRDFYAPKATQQPTIGDTKFSVIRQDHMGWLNCDGRLVSTEDYPLLFRVIEYSFGGNNSNLFRLPDMRSAVPGAIGPGSNYNFSSNVSTYTLGNAVGEETHTLIRAEMPEHTHGSNVATGNDNGNGYTTTNGDHFHTGTTSNDGGHIHTYTDAYFAENAGGGGGVFGTNADTDNDNDFRYRTAAGGSTTNPADAQLSTSSNTGHTHQFTTSNAGDHFHQIFNTGGSQPHNNMQPTVFIGNMFIYSGKIHGTTSKWRYELDTNIL